jgi:hypothetical protein
MLWIHHCLRFLIYEFLLLPSERQLDLYRCGNCPFGHYVNTTNSSCELCPSSCLQCSSTAVCSSRALSYYLYDTQCIANCPNTTFSTSNTTARYGSCQLCNSCATCSSSTTCTSCIASEYFYNAICYSKCRMAHSPIGFVCSACTRAAI